MINEYSYVAPTGIDTPIAWIIWGTLTIVFFVILLSSIFLSIYFYRKNNKKFLTIDKVAMLSIYLTFFLIQAFVFSPMLKLPIPFSFDSITTIAVGFIFGPLEGILFGWVADSFRVLINGWSYQFLPGMMYPMIGLIAGISGIIWNKRESLNKNIMIILFQVVILLLFISTLPLMYLMLHSWDAILDNSWSGLHGADGWGWLHQDMQYGPTAIMVSATVITSFAIMELMFFWFMKSENKKEDLLLFMLLSMTAMIDRGMELVIRPFMQWFTGYEQLYGVSLVIRLISSTYLIPVVSLTSFWLIKFSSLAVELK